jgi:hypothetical protein
VIDARNGESLAIAGYLVKNEPPQLLSGRADRYILSREPTGRK